MNNTNLFRKLFPLWGVGGFLLLGLGGLHAQVTVVDSGTCGSNLTWFFYSDSTLAIHGSGNMPCAFPDRIKTLIIGDSVTSIGTSGFRYCSNLTSVTIGEGVTGIGDRAFQDCINIQTVNYNAINCTIIPPMMPVANYLFAYCPAFTTLNIGSKVQTINYGVFFNCTNLTSITVHANIPPTSVNWAFHGIPNTIPVYIPCLTYNSYSTAYQWRDFTNFVINGNPTPDTTFYNVATCSVPYTDSNFTTPIYYSGTYYTTLLNSADCDSTICLTFTSVSLTNYSAMIYQECTYTDNNFTNLTQAGTYYDTLQNINGCDSIICLTLTLYPNSSGTTGPLTWYLNLCDSTLTISGSGAMPNYASVANVPWFSNIDKIKTVIIGDSVTSIGNYAFLYCSNLNSITIGNSVTSIGDYAFYDCFNLVSLTVYSPTPPALSNNIFHNVRTTASVYVPCKSVSAYQTAWTYFSNYIGMGFTDTTFLFDTICFGMAYNNNDFHITEGIGIYYRTISSVYQCDSVICLTLEEYPQTPITRYSDTIYQGENYNDNNFKDLTESGIYYDTLQTIHGCDSIIELTLIVTVGIIQLTMNNEQLIIYPNPTTGQLIIEIVGQARNDALDIEIYDIVGSNIPLPPLKGDIPPLRGDKGVFEITIDISHLAKGIYFLKIQTEKNTVTKKIVKQ